MHYFGPIFGHLCMETNKSLKKQPLTVKKHNKPTKYTKKHKADTSVIYKNQYLTNTTCHIVLLDKISKK